MITGLNRCRKLPEYEEMNFLGEFTHAVDGQRRVAVPKNWRGPKDTPTRFFALPGRNQALHLLPDYAFQDFMKQVRKVSFLNPKVSRALAQIGAKAQELQCDKQGRIALSQYLKDYAQIDSEAVLVGAFTTAQIWSKENWLKQDDDPEATLDVIDSLFNGDGDLLNALQNLGDK